MNQCLFYFNSWQAKPKKSRKSTSSVKAEPVADEERGDTDYDDTPSENESSGEVG